METVTVPKEPTAKMVKAAQEAIDKAQREGWAGIGPADIYRAMIGAATK